MYIVYITCGLKGLKYEENYLNLFLNLINYIGTYTFTHKAYIVIFIYFLVNKYVSKE